MPPLPLDREQQLTVGKIWITYALFYLGRVNLSPVLPALAVSLNVSRAEVGALGTVFFWVYAIGQFVNGELGSHFSPRKIVAIGLLVIGLVNLAFSVQTTLLAMMILWGINGFAQSMGWPPMLRIIAERFDRAQVKRVSTIMPISYVFGTALTWAFIGFIASDNHWQIAFWLPGVILLGVLAFWWSTGIDAPKSSSSGFQLSGVLAEMRSIWFVLIVSALTGSIYIGGLIWLPTYIADTGLVPERIVGLTAALLQIIALMGLFIARYWVNRSGTVFVTTASLLIVTVLGLVLAIITTKALSLIAIALSLLVLNGAVGLVVSSMPLILSAPGRASSVAGTINALSNFGGGVSGILVGALAESNGWNAVFGLWAITAFAATLLIWTHRGFE